MEIEHFMYPFAKSYPLECLKLLMTCKDFYKYKKDIKVEFYLKLKIIFDEKSKNSRSFEYLQIFPFNEKNFQQPLNCNNNDFILEIMQKDKNIFMLTTEQFFENIITFNLDRKCEFWHSIKTDKDVLAYIEPFYSNYSIINNNIKLESLRNKNNQCFFSFDSSKNKLQIFFKKNQEVILNIPAFICTSTMTFDVPVNFYCKIIFLKSVTKDLIFDVLTH